MTLLPIYRACRARFPRFVRPPHYPRHPVAQPLRRQHDGPHKEYFQTPGQMPLPDAPTALPEQRAVPVPVPFLKRPRVQRTRFIAKLILYAAIGGFIAGRSLITWAYLQGPFEAGTEEEHEMLEEVAEMMNEYTPLETLVNDPDWVEWPVAPPFLSGESAKGMNLVTGTLSGSKGIVQRIFFHRNHKILRIVIYFGNGIEGWPAVVHGGAICTILKEAIEKLAPEVLPMTISTEISKMRVTFADKIVPGEVYTLLVAPPDRVRIHQIGSAGPLSGIPPPGENKNVLFAGIIGPDSPSGSITPDTKCRVACHAAFKERAPVHMDELADST